MAVDAPEYIIFRDCIDRPINRGDVVLLRSNQIAPIRAFVVTGFHVGYDYVHSEEHNHMVQGARKPEDDLLELESEEGYSSIVHPSKVLVIPQGIVPHITN